MLFQSIFRLSRANILKRFNSTQVFGDIKTNTSTYRPILLTSAIAASQSYAADPIKSIQDEQISGYSLKKFNHLIDNIAYSNVTYTNLREYFVKNITEHGDKVQIRYMVCENVKEKLLIVAIRGSTTTLDWIQDAHIHLKKDIFELPGKVHAGFSARANQVPINFFINKIVNEGYRCIFTGHSLGGAAATLVAIRVLFHEKIKENSEYTKNILCVGFGTPAVGTSSFVNYVDEKYKENFHFYVNNNDLVVLQTFLASHIYIQFGKTIFLHNDGTYKMLDKYSRKELKIVGKPMDHPVRHYIENIVKLLEKEGKNDIYVESGQEKNVGTLNHLLVPVQSIKKHQPGTTCDLEHGCKKFCNQYSIFIENRRKIVLNKNRIILNLCCKNAEYIYRATLQLEGYTKKCVDNTAEMFGGSSNTIQFDFKAPKSFKLKPTKGILTLTTHFEEVSMPIEITESDLSHND